MTITRPVFLFDVDNTLLDNDRITADLRRYLGREVGAGPAEQYFEFFEELRRELGYADYLGALQRYRIRHPRDPHLLAVSSFLVNYPFANRLFPGSLDAIEHVAAFGAAVILSDGDVVFQPRKVERSGLFDAVEDITIERIGELVGYDLPALLGASPGEGGTKTRQPLDDLHRKLERHVVERHRTVLCHHVHVTDEETSLQVGCHRVRLDHDQLVLSETPVEHHRPAGIVWNRREGRLEDLRIAMDHRALNRVALIQNPLRAAINVSRGVADLHDLLHVEVELDGEVGHLS